MANYRISDNKRSKLRENAIKGASQYLHYLVGKDFLIVCEDGNQYDLHFLKSDYKHLTGIDSNLDDDAFFDACKHRILDIGNINEYQKYNWQTLNSKSKRIVNIHRILYANVQNTLFMINLDTRNRTYPVAIKNIDIDTCVGFINERHTARTLRKYNNSNRADKQKKIDLIVAKNRDEALYFELVYISTIQKVFDINSNIFENFTENLQNRFLEILTRHKN